MRSNGIYKINTDSGKEEEFLLWSDTDLNYVGVIGDGAQIGSDTCQLIKYVDEETDENGHLVMHVLLVTLTKETKNPHAGKTVLTLGDARENDADLVKAVVAYNLLPDKKVRIEVHDYSSYASAYGAYEKVISKIADQVYLDLLAGTGPDILVNFATSPSFQTEDVLLDLTPYISGDGGLSDQEYYSTLLRAYEKDGKVFHLPTNVELYGFWGNSALLPEGPAISASDFDAVRDSLPENTMLLPPMEYDDLLKMLLPLKTGRYIDLKNSRADFSDASFAEILDVVKKYGSHIEEPNEETYEEEPTPTPTPAPDPDPDPNPAPAPLPAPAPDPQPASDPQPGPSWQDHLFVITYGDGSQVAYNLNVDSISATATEPAPAAPITPPAKTERTVKGTVDHATHLEKVDDVVNQLEGNTLTALQNGNAVFSAAFDVQNADMLDSGIVDFGGAFEEAEEDVILVPSVSGQYFENNTYTVVYSDGTVVHAVCTNAGVLWIPFPHDAKGLAFVVLKGTVESSQLVKHTILAAETLDSGAGSVTLQFDANQVAGPIVDGIHNEVPVQNTGWTGGARDGELAGTTGQSRRLEAVRVSLTGDALMDDYSVWYRVHSQTYGWLGWAHDGEPAGTAGLAKRAEAIDVQVLPQGQVPRGYDATQRAPAAQTGGTTGAFSAAGDPAEGTFSENDALALLADALNSILENDRNARNAQRSAANANAAGTTEATTAAVNRGDVADNAQQTNNANALGVYSPTGDHSGALGD